MQFESWENWQVEVVKTSNDIFQWIANCVAYVNTDTLFAIELDKVHQNNRTRNQLVHRAKLLIEKYYFYV